MTADNFWDAFTAIVEDFKKQTKDFTESEVFSLRYEPSKCWLALLLIGMYLIIFVFLRYQKCFFGSLFGICRAVQATERKKGE